MTTAALDFLAEKALSALAKQDMAPSWLDEKRHYFTDMDRLAVLRSFANLDDKNQQAVCDELGADLADLKATLRFLRKI